MTDPIKRLHARKPAEIPLQGNGQRPPLTTDQVRRWAEMIVKGQTEMPGDLPATDGQRLAAEVRRLHRDRLLTLVSRAIARQVEPKRPEGKDASA